MMRLVLAPKSMQGIKEKLLKSRSQKSGPKIPSKIIKMENIAAQDSLTPRVSNPYDYINHMFKRP
jgi:hypothetical protein